MVKDFKVALNRSPQQVFFPGSEVSGTLSFQINELKSYKNVKVALIGRAHVHWSESHGSGNNRRTVSYTSHREYVNLQSVVWSKDQTPDRTLHTGQYNFPFRFSLPNRLPSSYGRINMIGWIRYFVEARIGTGLLKFDHVIIAEFPVVESVNIDSPQLQVPLRDTVQKTICCWCCASGPITMTAETPRSGYCIGEVIPVTINIENGSSRVIQASVALQQRVVYTAQGHRRYGGYVAIKLVSGPMQPRSPSIWSPGDGLKIPPTTIPSLSSCDIINVSYNLVVSVVIPRAVNSSVRFPLTIGNIPLRGPNQSSFSSPLPVAPPYSQLTVAGSQLPVPGPIVGWTTPALSHYGPSQPATTWNSEEPPPYDVVVSNTTKF